jgi:hypothetical protein
MRAQSKRQVIIISDNIDWINFQIQNLQYEFIVQAVYCKDLCSREIDRLLNFDKIIVDFRMLDHVIKKISENTSLSQLNGIFSVMTIKCRNLACRKTTFPLRLRCFQVGSSKHDRPDGLSL